MKKSRDKVVSIGFKLLIPIFICFIIFGGSLAFTIDLLVRSKVQSTSGNMTSHMDDVKKEMDELTGIVQAIERGIIEMGDSAREVSKAAETVLELAKDTCRNIQIMEGTIGSFKV